MAVRVYAPDAEVGTSRRVGLPSDEAEHVTRVLRLGAGASLRVFDGRGHEWQATVAEATRAGVVVTLDAPVTAATETRVRYTLAHAVLKGDGTDDVVRDAVMMGVTTLQPMVSTRSEISLSALTRSRRVARWERIAVASAKQAGRAVVPCIEPPRPWADVVSTVHEGVKLLLLEPSAAAPAKALTQVEAPLAVTLAVGPEGGWTPEEVEAAVAGGWWPVRLGGRTLRAAATPIVALAACQAVWRDE